MIRSPTTGSGMGTGLMRWRPDKAPWQCRMDQLHYELRPSQLADIEQVARV